MTSEKELRQIAHAEVRRAVEERWPLGSDYPWATEVEWDRVIRLIRTWPIPDLPPADTRTWGTPHWWPKHGRNYGHVRTDPERVTIARGFDSIHLTPAEAEELGSLLLAAAHYHREDQE